MFLLYFFPEKASEKVDILKMHLNLTAQSIQKTPIYEYRKETRN